jgi:hypothetical protein
VSPVCQWTAVAALISGWLVVPFAATAVGDLAAAGAG